MNPYDIGDEVELFAAFTSRKLTTAEVRVFRETLTLPEGIGVEPGSVVSNVRAPDGTVAEVANEPTATKGVYVAVSKPKRHGTYYVAWDGSEGFQASGERGFKVREQRVNR